MGTFEQKLQMREVGVRMLVASLDSATPALHTSFRQQVGSCVWTVAGLPGTQECGLPARINTRVTSQKPSECGEPISCPLVAIR